MVTPSLPFIIVDAKVDEYVDTMIEDIQDIIKVESDNFFAFKEEAGILPPRYKELKEELKQIVGAYVTENIYVPSFKFEEING